MLVAEISPGKLKFAIREYANINSSPEYIIHPSNVKKLVFPASNNRIRNLIMRALEYTRDMN